MLRQVASLSRALQDVARVVSNPWMQILVGLLAAVVGAVVRLTLSDQLGDTLPFLTFFPAVAVAAWAAGLRGGIAATAVSSLIAAYFLLAPDLSIAVHDVLGFSIFVVACVLISALGGQLHATRRAAELGRDRAAFLSDASAILNQELDPRGTLDSLSRAAVPRFADWCAIDLFAPDGSWSEARISAVDPTIIEIANRIRRDYPYGVADPAGVPAVFRTGNPEFALDVPEGFMDVIQDSTLRDLMSRLGIRSYISVPLASPPARKLGVLTVVRSTSGRRFTAEDVGTAVDLGRRAGTALEHATLFRDTKLLGDELDAVIRALDDPVLVARADGAIVRSNAAATKALGETIGRNLDTVVGGLSAVPGRASVQRTAGGTYVSAVELEAATADSTTRIVILRDLSDVIRTEAARDAFVGMLSHELRTPITTIYGVAQVLRKSPASDVGADLITDLALETERLYRLVEDLLVLSRFERGRLEMSMEPVLVNRVVDGAVRRIADLYPSLSLDMHADVALPPVMADATYLEQVIRNMASNAVKYAGEQAHLSLNVGLANSSVRIRIEDDGPGIAPENLDRIFELYERLDESAAQPGSGIGLFVCKQLIEAMGGTIAAGRAESGGASFTIDLPVVAAELMAEPTTDTDRILVPAGED